MIWTELKEILDSNESFLISSHQNPDGDCIGSQLAFCWYLKSLGKKAAIYDADPVPYKFHFLSNMEYFLPELPADTFDVLVILDSSNPQRMGWKGWEEKFSSMINIDHHLDNTRFADSNVVDPNASSTGELIFRFFNETAVDYPKQVAEALYTAIMTDTGGFRFSNTNAEVLRTCATLVDRGADCAEIYQQAFVLHTHKGELLRAKIYSTLSFFLENRVCTMELPLELIEKFGASYGDSEGMADNTISASGVEVGMLIKHRDNKTHFSLRSTGSVDVGVIARSMGGGGHKSAAGCSLEEPFEQAREKILSAISDVLAD